MKQPAAGLSYFTAALDADPACGQYWLSYIDALIQADQLEDARQILALARQQGLQGDEVSALAMRLEDGAQTAEHLDAEHRQPFKEPLPVSSGAPQHITPPTKNKPVQPGKPAGKHATYKGKAPSSEELNALVTLFNKGLLTEAASLAQEMTARFPLHWVGWKVLGAAFQQMGRNADALMPMQQAAVLAPTDVEAHKNLGVILNGLGRLDDAEVSLRRALKIKPDYAEALGNLGRTLKYMGRLGESKASLLRALQIKPDFAEAHCNLGATLFDLGRLDEAEASYRQALQFKPDFAEAHNDLGSTLSCLGRQDEAVENYRRAMEIKSDFDLAHSNLLFSFSHDTTVDAETLFAEHCRFGEQFEAPLRASWPQHTNLRSPDRILQIGFVSGDLRNHAVASFIEPVLAHLSGYPQLSLHAYFNHAIEDAVTQRIREHFTHWHPIAGLSDADLTKKIRADSIDICKPAG
jgi:Flp pilus assembly protein TadD